MYWTVKTTQGLDLRLRLLFGNSNQLAIQIDIDFGQDKPRYLDARLNQFWSRQALR